MTPKVLTDVLSGIRKLGYLGSLLQENYTFPDWFSTQTADRRADAVAFGELPASHESACIGVVTPNGAREANLVAQYRALGAPIILEVAENEIREWAVSPTVSASNLIATYPADRVDDLFVNRGSAWEPRAFLRAKNIGRFDWAEQLTLFAGLLPELEDHIQAKLDPLLIRTLAKTKAAYKATSGQAPNPEQLFQLVFWMLTAKVFSDRRAPGFSEIWPDPPETILAAVSKQYQQQEVPRLLNREARTVAAKEIWSNLDFRHLSVEVLSEIWSTTLVDTHTRRRLGIHRTPRSIVRYMVGHIPFETNGDDKKIVFEPCSGSAAFLIGAMTHLRQNQLFGMAGEERHAYFVKHLVGMEQDSFGVQISRLALTLADYPHPGEWNIRQADVFQLGAMTSYLKIAGVVLCNPPFENLPPGDRRRYEVTSIKKPAELLLRVLADLHPSGVIGFVLPRPFLDGGGYKTIRQMLVRRFSKLTITELPDKAFERSDHESVLLVARDPIPHGSTYVTYREVDDTSEAWRAFEACHAITSERTRETYVADASAALLIPDLPDLWAYLETHTQLSVVAEVHRGIEWTEALTKKGLETGRRSEYEKDFPSEGYLLGVKLKSEILQFQVPRTAYLSVKPRHQRHPNFFRRAWAQPKAILNQIARSRGRWRIAAFPDSKGLVCYQTSIAVWPKGDSPTYDEVVLSAILNSPIANAFVATREGKRTIKVSTLRSIPMAELTTSQSRLIRDRVLQYQRAITDDVDSDILERLLKCIDAVVLDAYGLPPRLETQLLDWFRGQERPVGHRFADYYPPDLDAYIPLSELLSEEFARSRVEVLRKNRGEVEPHILEALRRAADEFSED